VESMREAGLMRCRWSTSYAVGPVSSGSGFPPEMIMASVRS
jgi:hypothetical protein